jgi:hypothetical protein
MYASTNMSVGSIPARCLITASTAARPTLALMLFLSAASLPGCNRDAAKPAAPASAYIVARTTHTIHRADCGFITRILPANRVPFDRLADALAEGYKPCRHCLHAAATQPRRAGTTTQKEKP